MLDADGQRLGLSSGSAQTWTIDDPHANPVAFLNAAATTVSDALRYDGYGQTLGRYTSGAGISSPWG